MKTASFIIVCVLLFVPAGTGGTEEWVSDSKTDCRVLKGDLKHNERVSWSGRCVDGYASGPGTMVLYHDKLETVRYEGELKNGKYSGRGTLTTITGYGYTGDFMDGKPHGKGAVIYPKGGGYEGDFVNGEPHGRGTLTWVTGRKYEGDFASGRFHGKGAIICTNGKKITGVFENGKPVGFVIKCD